MLLWAALTVNLLVSASFSVEVRLNQKPVAGQKIEFIGFKEGEPKANKEILTNAQGIAKFEFDPKEEMNLVARTFYENISYFSPVFISSRIPKTPALIEVFKTATSNPEISITDLRYFISATEAGLKIDQEIVIENPSHFTIVGDPSHHDEVFRFTLPPGAFDLRFNFGFDEKETKFEGNDIIISRPLLPGTSRFNFSFAIEKPGRSFDLQQTFSLPVEKISFGTDRPELKILGLNLSESTNKVVSEKPIRAFDAKIEKTKEIQFKITGLPLHIEMGKVIPLAGFFLLFILGLSLSRDLSTNTGADEKKRLLQDLQILLKLKSERLISENEFQRKRIQILEKLAAYYPAESAAA
ncbi:MAG: hypothetical protein J0L93_09525 [Deltaproteobacteria bacterium]|nr:hypothetical protein [Deltaproteobacteria bacterium]